MAKVIEGKDIIKPGSLNEHIKQVKDLQKAYDSLNKSIDKVIADEKKMTQTNFGKNIQDIQKLEKSLKNTTKARQSAMKVDKEQAKISKQLKTLTDEEVKAKIRFQNAAKKQRDVLRDVVALENREIGTLEKARITNRKLRKERDGLNLSTEKGRKRLQQINAALDRNNALIKRNSDAMKRQRLNVGNYGSAVAKVGGILKGFGATMLATFSIRMVGSFFKASIDGFRTQEKAVKKVEQAINSTGGAAGRTSEELQKMASSLQENSLFGDEQILNEVTAQLLTFTNISDTQFDRTQQVALDLATVLDGDLKSASIQLGKALNDPIANLSALSRSGIQFSAEQKELIKSLAETGRLAEAQSVILDELERQYGGQAKAAAEADGGIQQLKNTFGDMQEIIGGELLKVIKPIAEDLKEFIQEMDPEDVKNFARAIGAVIQAFADWGKDLFKTIAAFGKATDSVDGFLEAVIRLTMLSGPVKLLVKPFEILLDKLGLLDDVMEDWDAALRMLGLDDLADDLELVSKKTAELTEEQKRNNTVRNKSLEIGNELLKQNEDELGDIPILIDALQDENTTREDKQAIIEKLNKDYPEVIGNIDLETASTEQLIQVKKDLVKQLLEQAIAQKKAEVQAEITGKILELELKKIGKNANGVNFLNDRIEELVGSLTLVDEVEAKLRDNLGKTIDSLNLESPIGATSEKITELKNTIAGLEEELKSVNKETEKERFLDLTQRLDDARAELARYNGDYKALIDDGLDREKEANDESVKDLKKTVNEKKKILDQAEIEEQLRFEQDQQRRKDLEDQLEENQKILDDNEAERLKKVEEFNKDQEKLAEQRINREKELEKKRQEDLKKLRDRTLQIYKDITDGLAAEIDKRIQIRQDEIKTSEDRIKSLQDQARQGDTNAAEAIKAEQVRIAKDKLEIDQLQRKKRNLLITVTALERVSQNIGSGDPNPFKSAKNSLTDFLSNLPTFFEGTDMTVADALGYTGTRDGHTVRVHDNEHVIGSKESDRLHRAGFKKTKDIVNAAMIAQNLGLTGRVLSKRSGGSDAQLSQGLENLSNALEKGIGGIQTTHIDPEKLFATITKGNNVKNISHQKGIRFE